MRMSVFFQKKNSFFVKIIRKFYFKFFLQSNKKRIKYLRDAGATIGENVTINAIDILGSEPYLVEIGDNTYFSGATTRLLTHDGGTMQLHYMGITDKKFDNLGKIIIGKNCFIGHNSIILKNVRIGDNVIVGAGAVVTKSIPSNSVVAGVPAKIVCSIEDYYKKNYRNYSDTFTMNHYEKRKYVEQNKEKFVEKMKK